MGMMPSATRGSRVLLAAVVLMLLMPPASCARAAVAGLGGGLEAAGGGGGGAGGGGMLTEDDAYAPDDDIEGLKQFREKVAAADAAGAAEAADLALAGGGLGVESPPDERDKELNEKVANMTHIALLKVMALSWPSEGDFGRKVSASLPPQAGKDYSWVRANRKAFRIITDVDHKTSQAPSEEVLMALGYRHFHGIGTRPDCSQALSCYNAVAASVARYMEERDSKETKLDLGVMRISLSEVDGILGETTDEDEAALEFDRLNAQGGDLWAQKELGWRSLVGKGVEEDMGHAQANLEAAGAAGDPEALHNLGYMHMNGLGVEQNYTKAKGYFDRAAEGNITAAFNALGYMYYQGVGVERNFTEAERLLKKAAEYDDADAAFNLASLYQELDRNMSRAYPLLEQASETGFWRAHLAVAEANEHGIGRSRNCTAAVVALKKLVETWGKLHQHPEWFLLQFASHGGVAQEIRDAVDLYKQGHHSEARQLFCELAEQGVEVAQSNCAWMTLKEMGMSKSENHTLRLLAVRRMFALGGQQGGADAHLRLGDMEWYGQGKDANISAAVEHYKLAASRRSHQASFIMGSLYHLGIGVQRNLTLARRMYKKSGSSDFTNLPSQLALSLLVVQDIIENLVQPIIPMLPGERLGSNQAAAPGMLSLALIAFTVIVGGLLPCLFGICQRHEAAGAGEGQRERRPVPNVADYMNDNE